MRRFPRLRSALWKFTVWYQYRPGTRSLRRAPLLWRPVHWLWCFSAPLGSCDVCREPTWEPVAFQVQLNVGRTGHYYCEQCGPPMRQAAEAMGELVVD